MQQELDGQRLIHELAIGYVWLCENCHTLIKRGEKRWQCQDCVTYNLCNRCNLEGVHDHHEKILETEDRLVLKDRVNADYTNATINNALRIFSHRPCLGVRHPTKNRYKWSTYGEVHTRVLNLAAGLVHLGIVPNELTSQRTFVSICAKNCLEWFIADYALLTKAVVVAPIHFTISDSDMSFIVNNSGSQAVFCSDEFVDRFSRYIEEDIYSSLKYIIVMNTNSEQIRQKYSSKSFIYSMEEVEEIGADKSELKNVIPLSSPDDLLTLVYTSGSTGTPKGAMIPDRVINESLHSRIRPEIEVWFTLAPLAHIVSCFYSDKLI
jgi:long-subunit acyl-CoA synthetase (AMP-forming)